MFRRLDREYRLNANGDLVVRAFNTLCADDRAIMLAYFASGENRRALAQFMGCSWPVIDDRLWRIGVVVRERYEQLRRAEELGVSLKN